MKTVVENGSGLLNGLVNYFGGKRKIVRLIAGLARGSRFCDLFFGGGSVGLYLKAAGFEVTAVDHSFLSKVMGKAYLENRSVKLTEVDLWRFFEPWESEGHSTLLNYGGTLFTARHANFFDRAVEAAGKVRSGTLRHLLLAVVAKCVFKLRAFGAFTNVEYMKQYVDLDDSGILHRSPAYYRNLELTTSELAAESMQAVNASVFDNGKVNRFIDADVFDFLKTPVEADTLYLDPPYYGSQDYEKYYQVVNEVLTGGEWKGLPVSDFNVKSRYFESIERIIEETLHVPRVILSYGGYKGVDERDRIYKLLESKRGGRIEFVDIPYRYSIHRTSGNGAGAREFVIVSDHA